MDGADIAEQFSATNEELIGVVLGPARDCWYELTGPEGWPVGVAARHLALGHQQMIGWARALKAGGPGELAVVAMPDLDAQNAAEAARGVVAGPEEVAQLLRTAGRGVVEALEELSEADLAGEVDFGGHRMPRELLATASWRHVRGHLASISEVLAGRSAP